MKDELLRDAIVIGIRDMKLSEKLQMNENLTLEKCIDQVMQSHQVKSQQDIVRPENNLSRISADDRRTPARRGRPRYRRNDVAERASTPCRKCGNLEHFDGCPAQSVECRKCHATGHFAKMCVSKGQEPKKQAAVGNVHKPDFGDEGDLFLGAVNVVGREKPWLANISLNGKMGVSFILDSGADITCLGHTDFHPDMGTLVSVNEVVSDPDKTGLKVVGKFFTSLKFRNREIFGEVYVIENLNKPLLGRSCLEPLGLIKRNFVSSVTKDNVWVKNTPRFSMVLGKCQENIKFD